MSAKTIATVSIGVGLGLLFVAIVCRFIITTRAMKAGIPRSFWLENVDFPNRQLVVGILGASLVLAMASMVLGFVYTAKADKEKAAETTSSSKVP